MKVLVTGGTGFLGSHLVDRLTSLGHSVRLLSRRANPGELLKKNVEIFRGDITDGESLKGATKGVEAVYHLAGILGHFRVSDGVYWNVHVKGTENILRESLRANLTRFVHCSSAGVLGPTGDYPANETKPPQPSNIYERTKWEGERIALEYFHKVGLPVVIARPEFVYGPGDLHVLGLFRAIQRGKFVFFGRGESLLHPTYIDDAVAGLLLCGDLKSEVGQQYIIAGEKPVTVKELVSLIAQELKVKEPTIHLPIWLGWLLGGTLEFLSKVLYFDPPLNRARVKWFSQNRAFSIEKAEKLGYKPQVSLKEGIARSVIWYREKGYI